jgi:hypothetical protein
MQLSLGVGGRIVQGGLGLLGFRLVKGGLGSIWLGVRIWIDGVFRVWILGIEREGVLQEEWVKFLFHVLRGFVEEKESGAILVSGDG